MKAKRKITALVINEGSAVDRPANQRAKIALFKRAEDGGAARAEDTNKESEMKDEIKKARSPEEIMAALPPEDQEVLNAAVKAAIARAVEQSKAAPPAEPPAEPPPQPEDEEKAVAKREADARVAVLQKRVDELEGERKRAEAIAKAQGYAVPGVTTDALADVLLSLDGNAKATEMLDGVLRAARAAHDASGITQEIGKRGDDGSPDAYAQLCAVAVELQKTGLSNAQAITKAAEVRPDLAAKCL